MQARPGEARRGWARRGEDLFCRGRIRDLAARRGMARLGAAWRGEASHGFFFPRRTAMAEHVAKIKVTGLAPLLMNNPISMARPGGGKAATKKIPTPEDEAASKVYRAKNGKKDQLFIPSNALRSALLAGGTGKRIGKMGAGKVAAAGVFTIGKECFLYHPETGKSINEYQIHTCRAVVMKAGVLRSRPEILEWACTFTITVDDEFLDVDAAVGLLNLGGKIAGVGDFRIEKKGEHGRFKAELISSKAA